MEGLISPDTKHIPALENLVFIYIIYGNNAKENRKKSQPNLFH